MRFELPGAGRALFTTRAEGNLSTMRGPGHERGGEQRDRLCEELGLRRLCASRQVHGATVHRVSALAETATDAGDTCFAGISESTDAGDTCFASICESTGAGDADGNATALRAVGTMVLVADCLPVVIGCEGAVAALHAGWRGLAAGVLEEGVRALRELGGQGEILAIVGPGARVCCYEVGEEVHAVFGGTHRQGRNLDLGALARDRLEATGARVKDTGVCTICDRRLFSHRREGIQAGRQAGIAWRS
jgi:copper oxidase (laccase) domain-containing protein